MLKQSIFGTKEVPPYNFVSINKCTNIFFLQIQMPTPRKSKNGTSTSFLFEAVPSPSSSSSLRWPWSSLPMSWRWSSGVAATSLEEENATVVGTLQFLMTLNVPGLLRLDDGPEPGVAKHREREPVVFIAAGGAPKWKH